ncbi:MAG: sulfatase [Verrucomicrobiaceae bacterium]|nr:sulfatase [Verrucomicrobiaceae bacterium]
MHTFRLFLSVFALVACLSMTSGAVEKPNFILINVDDLGWTDLGCFGSKFYETPHIDGLAEDGMRFTDAYAACAVCSPTRAAIMTGRYPARLGVTDWIRARFQGGKIPEDKKNPSRWVGGKGNKVLCPANALWMESSELTIAELLNSAGYRSCHIGKWHLGADDWYPEKQGFDENYGGCDYGQPPSYHDPFNNKRLEGIYGLPGRKKGQYLTDRESDEALGFIERNKDRPFFLYFANYAVHTPIQAKQSLLEKYQEKAKQVKGRQKNAAYATMVESVDQAVGRIRAKLEELKISGNTVIIFTSDNGGLLGPTDNAPLRSGKGNPYEGGIRVPLIVHWPDITRAESVSAVPVSSVDYLPTICRAAGIKPPAGVGIDGIDLMPVIKGGDSLGRENIFWHFPHYRGRIMPYSIVRSGSWKLLKRYAGKPYELFNLAEDIGEKEELSEKMPDKVKELDAKLGEWLKETGAKVPRLNPDYAGK